MTDNRVKHGACKTRLYKVLSSSDKSNRIQCKNIDCTLYYEGGLIP